MPPNSRSNADVTTRGRLRRRRDLIVTRGLDVLVISNPNARRTRRRQRQRGAEIADNVSGAERRFDICDAVTCAVSTAAARRPKRVASDAALAAGLGARYPQPGAPPLSSIAVTVHRPLCLLLTTTTLCLVPVRRRGTAPAAAATGRRLDETHIRIAVLVEENEDTRRLRSRRCSTRAIGVRAGIAIAVATVVGAVRAETAISSVRR